MLLVLLVAPAPAWAAASGAIAGRVVAAPRGAVASAVFLASSDDAVRKVPVAGDGTFTADDVPAGRVSLAVQTEAGLYAVDTPIVLAPGERHTVRLALRGAQDTNPPEAQPPEKKRKSGAAIWNNPLTASLVVIGAAIVVGVAVDQISTSGKKTPTASASKPSD